MVPISETHENETSITPQEETDRQIVSGSVSRQFIRVSPIPPPEDFEGYKRVNPDFPERILKQFEEDSVANRELQKELQTANIEMNKRSLDADIEFEKRSQWMAFILMTGFLLGTIILAYLDKDSAALASVVGAVVFAFKGVFAKNPVSSLREEEKKADREGQPR